MAGSGAGRTRLPLFPLGTVLFPGTGLPLHLFEERYRRLMQDRAGMDPLFGVVLTRRGWEVGEEPDIHGVGTAASLVDARRYDDGRYDVVVVGGRRFRVIGGDWSRGYLQGDIEWLDEAVGDGGEATPPVLALVRRVERAYRAFLAAIEHAAGVTIPAPEVGDDPITTGYGVAAKLPIAPWERQRLLEIGTASERLAALETILRRERALLEQTGVGGATLARPGSGFSTN